jgi:uncharacterized protein (DUF1800 family)
MAADMNSPLESIDPKDAWAPARSDIWNLRWAAHLYRRAGFGAPPAKVGSTTSSWDALRAAVDKGMQPSLDELFIGAEGGDTFAKLMDSLGKRIAQNSRQFRQINISKLQGWWLYRMLFSPHPLRERLTLFWHDHFATSVAKVGSVPLMYGQNELLRRHALESFRMLLEQIGRDPAMVIWLDNNRNTKGNPNENYAREIMELFSVGVGNYTEKDIQETARAFTGWGAAGGKYVFNALLHDNGEKSVLGQTGNWDGDDIVRILLEQPAAARFIIRKMYRHFVSEIDPPDGLLEPLEKQLRKSDYDIAGCLRTMLSSALFFSRHSYRQRIKGPVEYVVSLLRAFDGKSAMDALATAMEGMGQSLFAPPNVKGWDGGVAWLNSATLLARHNFAWKLLVGGNDDMRYHLNPSDLADSHGKNLREKVDFLLDLLLQSDVSKAARQQLVAFRKKDKSKKSFTRITHAILTMPEYQLA